MKLLSNHRRPELLIGAFVVCFLIAAGAGAAAPTMDTSELLSSGFKVLVAKTQVQKDWVKNLPKGQIRPMQRTGKKYFIYPDAPGNRIYIGGPKEYEAYHQLHPETQLAARQAVQQGTAYREKSYATTKNATARDLTDPFLGADWVDLGVGW